jgi:hypothetical protein
MTPNQLRDLQILETLPILGNLEAFEVGVLVDAASEGAFEPLVGEGADVEPETVVVVVAELEPPPVVVVVVVL